MATVQVRNAKGKLTFMGQLREPNDIVEFKEAIADHLTELAAPK